MHLRTTGIVLGLIAALMLGAGVVHAALAGWAGHGGHGFGANFGHVYGEIIRIDGDVIVVAPRMPGLFADKLAAHGVSIEVDLPAEVLVTVTTETAFYIDGEPATREAFAVGDTIAARGEKTGDGWDFVAARVGDDASFKRHVEEMHARFADKRDGHGHPLFGEITAVDGANLTLAPEIPDFIQQRIDAHHAGISITLPAEVTVTLAADCKFMVDGAEVDALPFGVGDKVALHVSEDGGGYLATGLGDYATAKQMLEACHAGEHPPGGHGCLGGHGGGSGHGM